MPAVFSQGLDKPTITNIPGGFFVEWSSPVEVGAMHLGKGLTGKIEVMFDISSDRLAEFIDRKPEPVSNPEMITALADYWMTRGKPERAISLYEGSLNRGNLDEARARLFRNNLAMLYSRVLRQHGRALEIVNAALDLDKDNTLLLNSKGLIFLNAGNAAEAIPVLQRAVELSCQLPMYCMHLAYALLQEGRDPQARRWFDAARAQLTELAPKMTPENKGMYDALQSALPPIN